MITEQLLSYIRDNMKAGYGKADIEVALRAAGWDALDIAAAFSALGSAGASTAVAMPRPAAAGSTQSDVNTELARIQAELKASKRSSLAAKEQGAADTGIIGWMIKHKMVSSRKQANLLLVGMTIISMGLIVWINFG